MSSERARLFAALALPLEIREMLVGWRRDAIAAEPALAQGQPLRLIDREALHVTLCFLGWQSLGDTDSIGEACATVAGTPAPELSLRGVLWLPPRHPRVLAVQLEDGSGLLADIQARLSSALTAGGWYRPDARPFLAHVSLARVATGARIGRLSLRDPPATQFTGEEVVLFRSRLGPGAARYEPLRTIVLRRAA